MKNWLRKSHLKFPNQLIKKSILHEIIKFLCVLYRKLFLKDFENGLTYPNSCIQIGVMPILLSVSSFAGHPVFSIFSKIDLYTDLALFFNRKTFVIGQNMLKWNVIGWN